MDTKAIAITIVFAALAIALTPIAIPAGFTSSAYRFWEIPIVVAFLLLGPKVGVAVAVLRTMAEITLFPGLLPVIAPLAALGGTMAMLLGVYVAGWLLKRKFPITEGSRFAVIAVAVFAILGALSRALLVPFVMYPVYRFFFPRVLSDTQIMALMPLVSVFAATLAIYTVAVGYLIARTINRNLGVGNRL